MTSDKIVKLTNNIKNIPTLPAVVTRVMQITHNPDSTIEDLLKAISPDVGITTSIIKLSNSPLFGQIKQVSSLKQALTILGFNEIRNMVLTKAVFNCFNHLKNNDCFDIRKFWEHCFLCGLSAKLIASEIGQPESDFFVGGLIHDIGKLIILMALPEEFKKINEISHSTKCSACKAEKQIMGSTHEKIGLILIKRWMFPENLLAAVGYHHQPQKAEKYKIFSIVTCLADILVHLSKIPLEEIYESDMKNRFRQSRVTALAESHGIKWNEITVTNFLECLAELKESEAGTLDLLLS